MKASDSNEPPHGNRGEQNDKLAQLLAKAGARPAPAARIEAEVRAAVHAEWLHLTQGRKRKQQRWLAAAAVLVCAISAGLWVGRPVRVNDVTASSASALGVIAQLHGNAQLNNAAIATAQIHANDVLRSGEDAGMRIDLSNSVSVRVAANTELQWRDANSLQLLRGMVYVDSHANAAPLIIHTARGDVTHLGTRYLVDVTQSLRGQSLHVAVREGKALIRATGGVDNQITIDSLQQVNVGANGDVARGDLQLNDSLWQWADALAQPFMMENRSVADFLQWVASETGCELDYVSPAVKAAASHTVLHGQAGTQPPLQAMQTVLSTTDFHAAVSGRQLVITQQR